MNINDLHRIYFIGIGGIGMSALARYFHALGKIVAGYDRVRTGLTNDLENEGIVLTYTDEVVAIPVPFAEKTKETLVVYTPAIPSAHKQLNFFKKHNFNLIKRAELLGIISQSLKTIAVAGTHGKTTVSTLVAHLLCNSNLKCNAFLGGIARNFDSNLVMDDSEYVVAEADEFDRSFLYLTPWCGIITAMDADHLDIYGTHDAVKGAFAEFANRFSPGGFLLVKEGLELPASAQVNKSTYSLDNPQSDYYASDIKTPGKDSVFTLHTPENTFSGLVLGVPGRLNVENAVAASALVLKLGVSEDELRHGLKSFAGIYRRFDYQYNGKVIYIDDYAHHPAELDAFIGSVRQMYPDRLICGIFQPHLYSRTRDFAPEFARSLSVLNELVLLPIYPARERPIGGVDSGLIMKDVTLKDKHILPKEHVPDFLENNANDIILTMGAGDIDTLRQPIKNMLKARYGE